jgi:hypothetical protein
LVFDPDRRGGAGDCDPPDARLHHLDVADGVVIQILEWAMDWQKAISDFLVATIPAVLLYFLGWAYLYYFLSSFGIYPSELKLDVITVLIYAYAPIHDIVARYLLIIIFSCLAFIFLIYFNIASPKKMLQRAPLWVKQLPTSVSKMYRPVSSLPLAIRIFSLTFELLIGMLLALSLILIPIAKLAAAKTEAELWGDSAPIIAVNLHLEDTSKKEVNSNAPTLESKADQEHNSNDETLSSEVAQCQRNLGLVPIFSDDSTLFVLCRNEQDRNSGWVFELRKEKGLVSARSVVNLRSSK